MKNNKGFTVVELVIVIAVVAILAAYTSKRKPMPSSMRTSSARTSSPSGCEIESVTVQMGDVTLTDAYDPAKQELRLQNVTENVNVTFVFKEK